MKLGIYKHSKSGREYKIIGIAKHSETLEEYVVYEAQYENLESKLWLRLRTSFEEIVKIDGNYVPRFQFVK